MSTYATLAEAFAAFGITQRNPNSPSALASDLTNLSIRPTRPSTSNPFPSLLPDAALIPVDTLNHIDYCIFIAQVDMATIQDSLWRRFSISLSIVVLIQIVEAERYIIEAMMAGVPVPEEDDDGYVAEPYRVRLRIYRTLAQDPGQGHEVCQEDLDVLNRVYLSALDEIADKNRRLAALPDLLINR